MSTLKQQITDLLRVPITDLGYEYLGFEFIPNHACSLLRIYIDHQQGITVEDCAVVSRQISALLDVEDPINKPYQLEVSSPGLHRPLFTAAQYAKFLQHEVILVLDAIMHKKPAKTGQKQAQSRNQRRGIIKAVNGELITVEVNGKEEVFALSTIQEAKLVPHLKSLV